MTYLAIVRPRARLIAVTLSLLTAASSLPAIAQQAAYPILVENAPDPLLANLVVPANAAQAGMWSRVFDWPIVPIHASVLPDGRVITFGAPPGGDVQDGRTLVFWDPRKGVGAGAFQTLPNAQNVDSFCSTATLLSDGKLLTSGGAAMASGFSSRESMLLDWKTSQAVRDYDLGAPRWYGTMTKLPDGRVVITGGGVPYPNPDPNGPEANPKISTTPEIYTPGEGWRSLIGAYSTDAFGAKFGRWWYPRQWVSPSGSLFGISTDKMWEMQIAGNGSIRTIGNFKTPFSNDTRPNVGPTSTAVMYDAGKILQVGGNGYYNDWKSISSAAATIIDITGIAAGRVTTTETAGMTFPRQWANATVLPNGRVLVTGGTRWADEAGENAVLASETWNPATARWTPGAAAAIYRGYHSTATLLPNGTVVVGGGGIPGPVTNLNAEIYYPAYLFKAQGGGSVLAARPRIVSLSTATAGYGQPIDVQTATGDDITEVSLTGLGSVTHSFDSNQRRMTIGFVRTENGIRVSLPKSPNAAPPGYYLLSIVNAAGTPSAATIVAIGAAAPAAAAPLMPGATGVQVGGGAATIAAAQDGTIVTANYENDVWVLPTGGQWNKLPGKFTDVAAIGTGRYYALAAGGTVQRWSAGQWKQVGSAGTAIAAAADGTVAVANVVTLDLWVKNADNDEDRWTQIVGAKAKDIAIVNRTAVYWIDAAGAVWRSNMVNPPVRVGVGAAAITASADGTVTVISQDGALWRKADDAREAWTRLVGTATAIATPSAQTLIATDKAGLIVRR